MELMRLRKRVMRELLSFHSSPGDIFHFSCPLVQNILRGEPNLFFSLEPLRPLFSRTGGDLAAPPRDSY